MWCDDTCQRKKATKRGAGQNVKKEGSKQYRGSSNGLGNLCQL